MFVLIGTTNYKSKVRMLFCVLIYADLFVLLTVSMQVDTNTILLLLIVYFFFSLIDLGLIGYVPHPSPPY